MYLSFYQTGNSEGDIEVGRAAPFHLTSHRASMGGKDCLLILRLRCCIEAQASHWALKYYGIFRCCYVTVNVCTAHPANGASQAQTGSSNILPPITKKNAIRGVQIVYLRMLFCHSNNLRRSTDLHISQSCITLYPTPSNVASNFHTRVNANLS